MVNQKRVIGKVIWNSRLVLHGWAGQGKRNGVRSFAEAVMGTTRRSKENEATAWRQVRERWRSVLESGGQWGGLPRAKIGKQRDRFTREGAGWDPGSREGGPAAVHAHPHYVENPRSTTWPAALWPLHPLIRWHRCLLVVHLHNCVLLCASSWESFPMTHLCCCPPGFPLDCCPTHEGGLLVELGLWNGP